MSIIKSMAKTVNIWKRKLSWTRQEYAFKLRKRNLFQGARDCGLVLINLRGSLTKIPPEGVSSDLGRGSPIERSTTQQRGARRRSVDLLLSGAVVHNRRRREARRTLWNSRNLALERKRSAPGERETHPEHVYALDSARERTKGALHGEERGRPRWDPTLLVLGRLGFGFEI